MLRIHTRSGGCGAEQPYQSDHAFDKSRLPPSFLTASLTHRLPLDHRRKTTVNESHSFPPSRPPRFSFLSFHFLSFLRTLSNDNQQIPSQYNPWCLFIHFTDISYHRTRLPSKDFDVCKQPLSSRMASCQSISCVFFPSFLLRASLYPPPLAQHLRSWNRSP